MENQTEEKVTTWYQRIYTKIVEAKDLMDKAKIIEDVLFQTQRGEDFKRLVEYIGKKNDFYYAPASTRFHNDHKYGLLEHSITVTTNLLRYTIDNQLEWKNPESPFVIGYFHDICKVGFYQEEQSNKKINGEWKTVPIYTVRDKVVPLGHHGERSVALATMFVKLNLEEWNCIRWHMGFTEPSELWMDYNAACRIIKNIPWAVLADFNAAIEEDTNPHIV